MTLENQGTLQKSYTATGSITIKPETILRPSGADATIRLKISEDAPIKAQLDDYQVSNLTYDANGNILSLKRNKNTDANGNNAMDDFVYHYDPNKPNQLKSVTDKHTQATDAEDLKTQPEDNYEYNEIGQLVYHKSEGIEYLYTTSGLVSEIKKSNTTVLKFFYNDRGQRVRKESYHPETGEPLYTEVYVRDAAGTPLAIYRDGELQEHTVYGQSRLGVYKRQADQTFYELTDHLGNVRAVISKDTEQQVTGTDYYPFGMAMPLRNSLSDYRYAYQGQEKDAETGKEAFQLRLWDARIGRWLTTDPYGQYASPYLGMGNNPVGMIDPDGGYSTKAGRFWGWFKSGFHGKFGDFYTSDTATGANKYGIGFDDGFMAVSNSDLAVHNSGFDGYVWAGDGLSAQFFGSVSMPYISTGDKIEEFSKKIPFGSVAYGMADDVFIFATSFALINSKNDPFRINGDVVQGGSSEHGRSMLNGLLTVVPSPLTSLKLAGKPLNAAKFSSKFKGTFVTRLKPKLRGQINRLVNRASAMVHGKLLFGQVKTHSETIETKINSTNN